MTLTEFCQYARISRGHLYNLWRKGEGPKVVKIGGKRMIRRKTGDKWLHSLEERA